MNEKQGVVESKEARFIRLATKRTQVALEKIGLVGRLASPNYRYTEDQVDKIVTALREAMDSVETKLKKQKRTRETFSL